MSYYGYPNPGAYNPNYQAYAAAAYAAGNYSQYQAAYNAAAYSAMQQQQTQQQPPPPPQPPQMPGIQTQQQAKSVQSTPGGVSISQPAQRYDYSTLAAQQQQANKAISTTASTSQAAYYANAYTSNMFKNQNNQTMPKWPQTSIPGVMPQINAGPGQSSQTNKKTNQFRQRRPGQQVQMFYCDVCKISCAGPQTYKEHLDGQKHKKRELQSKSNEKKQAEQQQQQQQQQATEQVASTDLNTTNIQTNTSTSNYNNRNQNRFSRTQNIIQCQLCDVACTGRDAYAAHIRGSKHQKTLKLHQKLGKPIPPELLANQTQLNQSQSQTGVVISKQAQIQPNPNIKTLTPPQVTQQQHQRINFVSGTNLMSVQSVTEPNKLNMNSNLTFINTTSNELSETQEITQEQSTIITSEVASNDQDMFDNDSSNHEPIGREYIETRMEGKILTFYCKLCDCKFNDPNAKDMHTKGRRHRLAYKKKVDPSLKVELKGPLAKQQQLQTKPSRLQKPRSRDGSIQNNAQNSANIKPLMSNTSDLQAPQSLQSLMSQPIKPVANMNLNQFSFSSNQQQHHNRHESFDDRHIVFKHNQIYPTQDEINAIQEIVTSTEKALKLVSDQIAEEDALNSPVIKSEQIETIKTENLVQQPVQSQNDQSKSIDNQYQNDQDNEIDDRPKEEVRALKGVMRVGLLAKGLLLKGDTDVKLIVICSNKPTKSLLNRVHKILLQKIEIVSPEIKYSIILDKEAETILIVRLTINEVQPLITCRVLLTSPAVREQLVNTTTTNTSNNINEQSDDLLDKQKCLDSLADLRHAKWFQARASQVPNCVVIIRILRDLCRRNPTWTPLSQWGLELLVERSLSSASQQMSPGEALRRVFECLSSGVLLPNEVGLLDPCEKDPVDVSDCLNNQQREELTASAHMALRLLAFKQIYKVLGIECINQPVNRLPKKRQHDTVENETEIEEKKEKKEDEIEKENQKQAIDEVVMKEENLITN